MLLYVNEKIKACFDDGKPLFDQFMSIQGEVFRDLEGRKTQRVRIGDQHYFIKQHHGVGAHEIIKNLLSLRLPIISAKNEWQAIRELKQVGISVPEVYAYGERGLNPASTESFVLMQEIEPAISLEELCASWQEAKPNPAFKRELINKVADIARIMHANGINHRDFYLCHILMNTDKAQFGQIDLSIIDLHRAQIREFTPIRWVIKDLAGLYFSSMDAGLTVRDCYRFMKHYSGKSLRRILKDKQRSKLWARVKERGEQLYRDHSK